MAYHIDTKILTPTGYKAVSDIMDGDVVCTPAGDTRVRLSRLQHVGVGPVVMIGALKLYGHQLVLTADLKWSYARAAESVIKHWKKMGFNCHYQPREPAFPYSQEASEFFSFDAPSRAVTIVRPDIANQLPPCQTRKLLTENGLVVADGIVVGLDTQLADDPASVQLTQQQLEEFRNAHF